MTDRRALLALLLAAAALWHALALLAPEQPPPHPGAVGRDYATYHYAAQTALAGGDPYDTAQLDAAAHAEGVRRNAVYPWIYPPPAVLLFVWAPSVSLQTGLRIWQAVSELALLGSIAVLAVGWKPLGSGRVLAILAIALSLMWGVEYGHHLGQANAPVLFLTLLGLVLAESVPAIGGGLVGIAVMVKLAPALFVGLLVLERRWRAVLGATVAMAACTVLSLAVVGTEGQRHFWTGVLPGLSTGDYNGLSIRIDMFANHSLPSVLNHVWPGGDTLSTAAWAGSLAVGLAVLAVLAALFHVPTTDPLVRAARIGAVASAALLLPVYTFDHHLVWLAPAIVAVGVGLAERRLPAWAGIPAGIALAVVCLPNPPLRRLATYYDGTAVAVVVEGSKHLALWAWLVLTAWLGRARQS
ncbi:MAG: glycosyltransferase family 87 protein [Myxococcota bacterium]